MKRLALILSLLLISYLSVAQGFRVIETPEKIFLNKNNEERKIIRIQNTSTEAIQVAFLYAKTEGSGENYLTFCSGKSCSANARDIRQHQKIEPGAISDAFSVAFKTGNTESEGRVRLTFFNMYDMQDSVSFEINYTVGNKNSSNYLYSAPSVAVSNFYPNPASSEIALDYRLGNDDEEVKVILQNILGSAVGEYTLSPSDKRLKINTQEFTPGVYFYTLVIDQKSIVTRKLIIKK
ncbi:T9SS type A sorting domain-containing protein [Cytophagales bacterium LB-30]|uniref:T9SS type A sorting domain-containing protein n=1 Tax=Shiella aurantiaca TaxID=3058365 RepID=A0ABT8F860_9BACT|nr:T9SS type A sorting domain-containing protein [Shiella aurantiaca]MDN4166565.1 T9SS type A sorting domain-containing protein [Shiella aurantiaca]